MKKQRTRSPKTQGVFSPNKVAASEALRLNCDSRNLGPNVDMPAMSVASVAPARQSRMNVGFFRRSQMELRGGEWPSSILGRYLEELAKNRKPKYLSAHFADLSQI